MHAKPSRRYEYATGLKPGDVIAYMGGDTTVCAIPEVSPDGRKVKIICDEGAVVLNLSATSAVMLRVYA